MGVWAEKRKECTMMIIASMRLVDDWNTAHPEEKKMILDELLENEIIKRFDVTRRTANDWIKDARSIRVENREFIVKQQRLIENV